MGDEGDRVGPRLARGCRSFAVLDAGALVSYGWLSTGREWIGELSLDISPAAGEAYIWNCVTLPVHRRKGRYRALLEGVVAAARNEGLARLWIGSTGDPAEKADSDVGFTQVLHFSEMRVGGVRWLRSRSAPNADQALVSTARSRLALPSSIALRRARMRIH
jgi:GNAT superfamily N-acetyltransferase